MPTGVDIGTDSPAGRAIGYRQALEYLTRPDAQPGAVWVNPPFQIQGTRWPSIWYSDSTPQGGGTLFVPHHPKTRKDEPNTP